MDPLEFISDIFMLFIAEENRGAGVDMSLDCRFDRTALLDRYSFAGFYAPPNLKEFLTRRRGIV
jgi:hypothetical protein